MRTPAQQAAVARANLNGPGRLLWDITPEEFDAFLEGRVDRDELHERADRRRAGREPVEPVGGSVQSRLERWSA